MGIWRTIEVPAGVPTDGTKHPAKKAANDEFGYASTLGKLMRKGVRQCLANAEVGTTHHRLTALLRNTLKQDTTNLRGQRRVVTENAGLLEGFSWREEPALDGILRRNYVLNLDVAGKGAELRVDGLVPSRDFRMDAGATHAVISLVLLRAEVTEDDGKTVWAISAAFDLRDGAEQDVVLSCSGDWEGGGVLVAGVGVERFQEVNGKLMPLMEWCGFEIGKVGV